MKTITIPVTFKLAALNREEWEEQGFDPEDYSGDRVAAVEAVTPEVLAEYLNEIDAEDWSDFLNGRLFSDDSAGARFAKVSASPYQDVSKDADS